MSLKGKILCIEGNIGVGKSTLCHTLKERIEKEGVEVVLFPEPFNQRMLEQFLTDQEKYAYAFQLYMLTRRQVYFVQALHHVNAGKCCIIDRSLMGDYVFARVQKELGNMTDKEFEIYQEVYDSFDIFKPDVTIFLDVEIEKIIERIIKRNRNSEDKYDIEYLKMVSKIYAEEVNKETNVNKWDWNGDWNDDEIDKLILNFRNEC